MRSSPRQCRVSLIAMPSSPVFVGRPIPISRRHAPPNLTIRHLRSMVRTFDRGTGEAGADFFGAPDARRRDNPTVVPFLKVFDVSHNAF